MGLPSPLFHFYVVFHKHKLQFLQQINVRKCPFCIWCHDLNSQPLEHETPPITTRPGLPLNTENLFTTPAAIHLLRPHLHHSLSFQSRRIKMKKSLNFAGNKKFQKINLAENPIMKEKETTKKFGIFSFFLSLWHNNNRRNNFRGT